MVSSVGTIRAHVVIDGVAVNGIVFQVCPDDFQAIDVLIGRTFSDAENVDYSKSGDRFTFVDSRRTAENRVVATSDLRTAETVSLPAQSICMVSVDNTKQYAVPVMNFGTTARDIAKGSTTMRGEISEVTTITRREVNPSDIKLSELIVGEEQPESVRQELCALLQEFRDCVATGLHDLGCARHVEMDIRLKDGAEPVHSKPYRATDAERAKYREIIDEWRDAGMVTDTQSEYASPVLLVRKKMGESRLCVDFRKLNVVTQRVHFPLPNIDDHLAQIRDSNLFIVLDLAHGYLQIPLARGAREKTAIITAEETVEFTRMIFGLMNGPAYFSKAMQMALGPLRDSVALFYLNDVLIPEKSWDDLGPKLRLVLEAFREAGLTIKLAKCRFLCNKFAYLGQEISARGIEPGQEKVGAIREFPAPKNAHEVRRFLGLTSYFGKFVP